MKRAILAIAFVVAATAGAYADCGPGGNGVKSLACNADGSSCCVRFCDGTLTCGL